MTEKRKRRAGWFAGRVALLSSVLVLGLTAQAAAAPGNLDPTFSSDGKEAGLTRGFGYGKGALALQTDGKIVIAGAGRLARYSVDGTLDPAFAGDGEEAIGFDGRAIALQGDGKVVVAGGESYESSDFRVARFSTDGTLDPTFSEDGTQETDLGGSTDYANDVAIQADGRIVVAGSSEQPADDEGLDFAVARYSADGTLDASFSGDGRQTTDFFREQADSGSAVGIQADGKIVVAGYSEQSAGDGHRNFAVARYDAGGTLDASFAGDGRQTTDFSQGPDVGQGLALQPDGKIVVAGGSRDVNDGYSDGYYDDSWTFALARYDADGTLDASFSGDGRQTSDFFSGNGDAANAVALQPDGRIVVAGQVSGAGYTSKYATGTNYDFALTRFDRDGAIDASFSGDGHQTTDFGYSDAAHAVAIQADGRIVAVGDSASLSPGSGSGFALARYEGGGASEPAAAPVLTRASISPSTVRIAGLNPSRVPSTTQIRFALSEPAQVRFTFDREIAARRVGRRCTGIERGGARRPRCVRFVPQGSFAIGRNAGYWSIYFDGRLDGRTLRAGRYRLTLRATDAAARESAPVQLSFRIVNGS